MLTSGGPLDPYDVPAKSFFGPKFVRKEIKNCCSRHTIQSDIMHRATVRPGKLMMRAMGGVVAVEVAHSKIGYLFN
jgi:hypothetical protein